MTPAALSRSLQGGFTPRWSVRSVGLAGVVTFGLYTLLPHLDQLATMTEDLDLRPVGAAAPPPPPSPPPPPRTDASPPPPRTPTPRLDQPPRAIKPVIGAMALEIAPAAVGGPLHVPFALQREDLRAAATTPVFELADLDRVPQALARVPPVYPARARARGIEGEVVVEFVVTPSGDVEDPEVVSSTPRTVFDEAALRAVRRWRFEPGMRGDAPVRTRVRQKIAFTLE